MFQVEPFLGTILFKTHHDSTRSLLPGQRGEVSDPTSHKFLSALPAPRSPPQTIASTGAEQVWWAVSPRLSPTLGPAAAPTLIGSKSPEPHVGLPALTRSGFPLPPTFSPIPHDPPLVPPVASAVLQTAMRPPASEPSQGLLRLPSRLFPSPRMAPSHLLHVSAPETPNFLYSLCCCCSVAKLC